MRLEFLLEEPSAAKALDALLPRLLPAGTQWHLYPHNGKQDLLRQLGPKLRAYSQWLPPEGRVVVVCDQHGDDCRDLKRDILNAARAVGLDRRVLTRIVVTELEGWFLGDPAAVEAAFPRVRANRWARKARYRDPDVIPNASQLLDRLLRQFGYRAGYQKLLGAEGIAPHMDIERNRSHSFKVFVDGLRSLVEE